MKFPLSLDLRKKTLYENLPGQVIIDADKKRIALVYPDDNGRYDNACAIVDRLNGIQTLIEIVNR